MRGKQEWISWPLDDYGKMSLSFAYHRSNCPSFRRSFCRHIPIVSSFGLGSPFDLFYHDFERFYNFSKFHQKNMALTSTLFSLGLNSSTLQISADERVLHATTTTVKWGDRREHRLLKPTCGFSFFLHGGSYILNAHIICWNQKFIFQSSRRWWGDGAVLMYIKISCNENLFSLFNPV